MVADQDAFSTNLSISRISRIKPRKAVNLGNLSMLLAEDRCRVAPAPGGNVATRASSPVWPPPAPALRGAVHNRSIRVSRSRVVDRLRRSPV
jgi:hypothetical protein